MALWKLLLISIASFSFLHFFALRFISNRWIAKDAESIVAKAAVSSLVEFLRTFFLIAGIVYSGWLVFVYMIQHAGGGTSNELRAAILHVQTWRSRVGRIDSYWSAVAFFALLFALVVLSYRQKKIAMQRSLLRLLDIGDEDLEYIFADRASRKYATTSEMTEIEERIILSEDELMSLNKNSKLSDSVETDHRKEDLKSHILELKRSWYRLYSQYNMPARHTRRDSTGRKHPRLRSIETLFVSESLMATFRGGTRLLLYFGLVLLFISLIGVGSHVANGVIGERIVHLEELMIEANQQEVDESWQKLMTEGGESAAKETTALDQEDEDCANWLAERFEQSLARELGDTTTVRSNPHSDFVLRSFFARQKILARTVASACPARGLRLNSGISEIERLTAIEQTAARDFEAKGSQPGPRTKTGIKFRDWLKSEVAEHSRSAWENIKTNARNYSSGFHRAESVPNITSMMFGEIFGNAVEGPAGNMSAEFGGEAQSWLRILGSNAVHRIYDMKSKQLVLDISSGNANHSQKPCLTLMEQDNLQNLMSTLPKSGEMIGKISDYPPGLNESWEPHCNLPDAIGAIESLRESMAKIQGSSIPHEITEALTLYEDWFPSQLGDETRSTRGKLLTKWAPETFPVLSRTEPAQTGIPGEAYWGSGGIASGGGGSLIAGSSPVQSPRDKPTLRSAFEFRRARSFARLTGFSRIGGVLIGGSPVTTEGTLDFRDITWEIDGKTAYVHLLRSDGTDFKLGPYKTSLIYYALSYAADGRPVAVTMVSAQPLAELRILLHPSFIDTPFGSRVIELDRFVDDFTGHDRARQEAELNVRSQVALYQIAHASCVLALLDTLGGIGTDQLHLAQDDADYLRAAESSAFRCLQDPDTRELAALALARKGILGKAEHSPLLDKREFFDEKLVEGIVNLASDCDSLQDLCDRIEQQTKEGRFTSIDMASMRSLVAPSPDFVVWSGVRELGFSIDPDLNFLTPPKGSGTQTKLWPLEFMLQVSFTSLPSFLKNDQDPESYDDQNPWDFPLLKHLIAQRVLDGVQKDPDQMAILEDMQQFTILQRIFRVALAGGFGISFPVEKLSTLSEAASIGVADVYCRTLRWNVRPGELEKSLAASLYYALDYLKDVQPSDSAATLLCETTLDSIGAFVDFLASSHNIESVSQHTWERECRIEQLRSEAEALCPNTNWIDDMDDPACFVALITNLIDDATYARSIRLHLGVAKDDRQARSLARCP